MEIQPIMAVYGAPESTTGVVHSIEQYRLGTGC